jgi:hypothetical protein
MKTLMKYLGRTTFLVSLSAITASVFGLVAYAVAHKFIPPHDPFWADARCALGLPAQSDVKCVQEAQRRLEREIETVTLRGKEIEAKLAADLDSATKAREDAERAAAGQDMVFVSGGAHNGKTLVVGALYRDTAARSGLLRAYCWAIRDEGGLDPRVALARQEADGRIVVLPPDPAQMTDFQWTETDLVQARALCPWTQ